MRRPSQHPQNVIPQFAAIAQWRPSTIVHVGVGEQHSEVHDFQRAWPTADLIGFEAHPQTFQKIAKTYPGKLHQIAISRAPNETTLNAPKGNRHAATIVPPANPLKVHKFKVPTISLDEFLADRNGTILLWLSCERGEQEAIHSAFHVMSKIDFVHIEISTDPFGKNAPAATELQWLLEYHNFLCQWVCTCESTIDRYTAVYVKPRFFSSRFCNIPSEIIRHSKSSKI